MDQKVCFEFPHKLIENLNIAYNVLSRKIACWNKYQIFLYEELDYKNPDHVCEINFTESRIAQLILSSNFLVCLDYRGAVFITRLKFKHFAHKRVKGSFEQREENILVIDHDEDVAYSLKNISNDLFFCIHKMNFEFELCQKFIITFTDQFITLIKYHSDSYIFRARVLSETEFEYVKGIFATDENVWNKQVLVIVSFDGLTLYALLVNVKSSNLILNPVELFKSPSQISSINFITNNCFNLIVSLTTGTVIKISLNDTHQTPLIVHLNTAIHKLLVIDDALVFTDGITMWKAENAFLDSEVVFKQFNIKYVKDFIRSGDELICTTYSKLIYILPLENNSSYMESSSISEYCSAENLLNNYDYLNKIMEEIEKNNKIIQKLKKEENYLATLALSNRHDVVDDIIQYNITVYESYEDILKEETTITLTNDIKEYFDINSFYFLIRINTTTLQPKFNDILANLLGNVQIHLIFTSDEQVLKTVSVKVTEQLKHLKLVIPLSSKYIGNGVEANIKLVSNIPGALNEKKTLWTALHKKKIVLGVEQFIKMYMAKNNINLLKEPKETIKDLICQTAKNHNGNLFQINLIENELIGWSYYVILPNNYEELLKNKLPYTNHFNVTRADYLFKEMSSERFLNSHKKISFNILNERIEVNILNDGFSEPLLMVSSTNPQIAFGVRNFFSNLIYNFDNYQNKHAIIISSSFHEILEV